jgi:hypothetical protein
MMMIKIKQEKNFFFWLFKRDEFIQKEKDERDEGEEARASLGTVDKRELR